MRRPLFPGILLAAGLILAACAGESKPAPSPIPTFTPTSTPPETATFAPGIYYRQPLPGSPETVLSRLDGPVTPKIRLGEPSFDIRPDAVIFTDDQNMILVAPDRTERVVPVPGIYEVVRPSFSPDGMWAAVQAVESPGSDLNIYVVNLETGDSERISFLNVNEESQEWFPESNRIVYSSFDPQEGIMAHVYDMDAGEEILAFDGGDIHLAVSPDERLIFNPHLIRLYDAVTGEMISDLKEKVLGALDAQGYVPDTRFAGQAGLGAFPLDADFSPDGSHIVLDGAVERDGTFGIVIFQMTASGDDLTPLTDLIQTDPSYTNNNNFSHLNPIWK